MLYDTILAALGKSIKDPAYRNKLLANPDATLKAEGADMGKASVKLDWVETTNSLNVHIKNGGANWSGAILLKIEK